MKNIPCKKRVSQYSSLVDKSDKSACPALAPEIQSISDQIHQFWQKRNCCPKLSVSSAGLRSLVLVTVTALSKSLLWSPTVDMWCMCPVCSLGKNRSTIFLSDVPSVVISSGRPSFFNFWTTKMIKPKDVWTKEIEVKFICIKLPVSVWTLEANFWKWNKDIWRFVTILYLILYSPRNTNTGTFKKNHNQEANLSIVTLKIVHTENILVYYQENFTSV